MEVIVSASDVDVILPWDESADKIRTSLVSCWSRRPVPGKPWLPRIAYVDDEDAIVSISDKSMVVRNSHTPHVVVDVVSGRKLHTRYWFRLRGLCEAQYFQPVPMSKSRVTGFGTWTLP